MVMPGIHKKSILPEAILNWLTSIPEHVLGDRVAHAEIVSGHADLMRKLRVPEAYMQWSDHADRSIYFRRGILESLDTNAQRIAWQFPHADEVHRMVADPEFVEFEVIGGSRVARFSAEDLSALGDEHSATA